MGLFLPPLSHHVLQWENTIVTKAFEKYSQSTWLKTNMLATQQYSGAFGTEIVTWLRLKHWWLCVSVWERDTDLHLHFWIDINRKNKRGTDSRLLFLWFRLKPHIFLWLKNIMTRLSPDPDLNWTKLETWFFSGLELEKKLVFISNLSSHL